MEKKNKTLLLKNINHLWTGDDKGTELRGADLLIEDNIIKKIGKGLKVKADRVIDCTDCAAIPGLVNTHHHLYQTLTRCIPDVEDVVLFDWLIYLYEIWRNLTPEAVYVSAKVGLAELLMTGCTTVSDHYYVFPKGVSGELIDSEIKAAKELGVRFHPCRGGMSLGKSKGGLPPDDVVQSEDVILADYERLYNKYHDCNKFSMLRIDLAPCSPFSVTTGLLRETVRYARKKGLRCHTHLAETMDEENFCKKVFGKSPLKYMESVEWLGPDIWFAHCVYMNDDEIKVMAETKTGVAHCPSSNLRLGSGIAPIRKMLDAGVPVGLAVDGSASNDSSDMLGEAREMLLVHRIKSGIKSMPVRDVLKTATRGSAKVLGRDDIGVIETGKAADIALFNINQIAYAGCQEDFIGALLLAGNNHKAEYVLVNGRVVVDKGRLKNFDEEKVYREAVKISRKMIGK